MTYYEWGSVEGDTNASAIISDRRRDKGISGWGTGLGQLLFIGMAVWYGNTGSHAALACMSVTGAWFVVSAVGTELFGTHTFVMIAERRAQLLEVAVQELRHEVSRLNADRRPATRKLDYD